MLKYLKLRREIAALLEENERLRKDKSDATSLYWATLGREIGYADKLTAELTKNRKMESEISELKEKLRKQNEADLLLSSLKISHEIINGAKMKDVKDEVKKQGQYAEQNTGLLNRVALLSDIGNILGF